MKKIAIGQIEKAVSGRLLCGRPDGNVSGVSTDSRRVGSEDAFFALMGPNFDAHDFAGEAVKNGAKCLIVAREGMEPFDGEVSVIKVDDTLMALQDLAKWYMAQMKIKKIGITGSTGKTTTKDLLYYICREKYKTAKTMGNLNNEVGLPLTVFSLDDDIEVAVLEMGAETVGEIHRLVDVVRPDVAIITNIGVSHIETFGSRENIFSGKMEIADFFGEENILVINAENDMLSTVSPSGKYRLFTVGKSEKNSFELADITESGEGGIEFTLKHMGESRRFSLGIPGRHNAINASLAVSAAAGMGISFEEAGRGLLKAEITGERLCIKEKNGVKVIDDTYNASPDSMRAAIDVLIDLKGKRKVAVLGDMLGLGKDSAYYHELVGEYAAKKNIDLLITAGCLAGHISDKAGETMGKDRVMHYESRSILDEEIRNIIAPGDVILVKGSRATRMENIVNRILE